MNSASPPSISRSFWSHFQPNDDINESGGDPAASPTPLNGNLDHGNPLSPNKHRRLAASASSSHLQPCAHDAVPAFPPCDNDDYHKSNSRDAPPNINHNPTKNSNVHPLSNVNVDASPLSIPPPALYSNYNYVTGKEAFPIDIPSKANAIICSIILATSSMQGIFGGT